MTKVSKLEDGKGKEEHEPAPTEYTVGPDESGLALLAKPLPLRPPGVIRLMLHAETDNGARQTLRTESPRPIPK